MKGRSFLPLLAISLSGCLASLGFGPESPNPAVVGTVFADGQPLSGAQVWVSTVDLREPVRNVPAFLADKAASMKVTDAAGRFALDVEPGLYHVWAQKHGFVARSQPINMTGTTLIQDLYLYQQPTPAIIAHRGASFYAPENTLPAILKAHFLGSNLIEVDVRVTQDGVPILMHDASLNRTTGDPRRADQATIEAVRLLDAGKHFHPSFKGTPVPTLAEALQAAALAERQLLLDYKLPATNHRQSWEAVVHVLQNHPGRFILAAPDPQHLAACVAEGFECAAMATDRFTDPIGTTTQLGATYVFLKATELDWWQLDQATESQLQVFAWTVNDPKHWQLLHQAGVHGIVTDYPGHLHDYLANTTAVQTTP